MDGCRGSRWAQIPGCEAEIGDRLRADLQAGMKLWGSILDVVSVVKDREWIPLFENPRLEELAPQGERFLSILSTALK